MQSSPRTGYTKTGKSLKAVRRYYALKGAEANKNKKPEDEDVGGTTKKRYRTPEDEKLSRRIAQEMKIQKEAIERRARNEGIDTTPTPSAIPLLQQTESTYQPNVPTFRAEPRPVANPAPAALPNPVPILAQGLPATPVPQKSLKSSKSGGNAIRDIVPAIQSYSIRSDLTGCFVSCVIIASAYVTTWFFMMMLRLARDNKMTDAESRLSSLSSMNWLAGTSLLVLIGIPYWLMMKTKFIHAMTSLVLVATSCVIVCVYLIYSNIFDPVEPLPGDDLYIHTKNPLNFWLAIVYLLHLLVAVGLMVKYSISTIGAKMDSQQKSDIGGNADRMSEYLAPS